jgi:cysteine-rich repeat protein
MRAKQNKKLCLLATVLLLVVAACDNTAKTDDIRTQTRALQNCGDPPDVLVVLDRSGSMAGTKWTSAVTAVNNLVTTFEGQIRFGLELFPSYNPCGVDPPQVAIDDETAAAIFAELAATTATGSATPIVQALVEARTYLNAIDPAKTKYVVLVTDGYPNCGSSTTPVGAVTALHTDGIDTFVIGFGTGVNPTLLQQMAAAGGTSSYYQANNQADLDAALGAIASFVSCCGNGQLDEGEECDDGNNVDGDGCSASCIQENLPPVALCQDVTVPADGQCQGCASVDNGSHDPEGDALTITADPACPYPLGDTAVTLTVSDGINPAAQCTATVTVVDTTPPVVACNAPATIVPPDAPIAFTATATDNCGPVSVVVEGYDCWTINGAGKLIDKTESCVVAFAGDTLTINDSGGVGDHITWTVVATDGAGNQSTATCEVEVLKPGR